MAAKKFGISMKFSGNGGIICVKKVLLKNDLETSLENKRADRDASALDATESHILT